MCVLIRVVWGMGKVPFYLCYWHVLKAQRLHGTKKIKHVEVWGGIFQDLHDVMYMSINHGETSNDFKDHGRVAMRENLNKHKPHDVWTN